MKYEIQRTDEFNDWMAGLKDTKGRARIAARLKRAGEGYLGEHKRLKDKDGLCELIFRFGPGYRVYYGIIGDILIVVVGGGDKGSQNDDIEAAHGVWLDEKESHNEQQTRPCAI